MPRVGISASVPAELAQALHARARKADRSFSAELCLAVAAHLGEGAVPITSGSPAANGAPAKKRDTTAHASAAG